MKKTKHEETTTADLTAPDPEFDVLDQLPLDERVRNGL